MSTESKSKPSSSGEMIEMMKPYVKQIISLLSTITPIIITYSQKAWAFYKHLPEDYFQLIIGFMFCFFGGVYPVCFAAIEAAKHGGFDTLSKAFGDLADEAMKIIEASKKDDNVDENKDGVKDVNQLDDRQLILRKVNLVIVKVNPEKVEHALGCIYKVWLCVIAVLANQFARTVAFAASINNFLSKPVQKHGVPVIQAAVPDQYDKWIPTLCKFLTKSIAISVAYNIQSVMSAFASSLSGSIIMTTALLKILTKKGFHVKGIITEDANETYFDETIGYVLAFLGFTFQFKHGFDVPFPLNIIFSPFEFAETFLRWSITKTD